MTVSLYPNCLWTWWKRFRHAKSSFGFKTDLSQPGKFTLPSPGAVLKRQLFQIVDALNELQLPYMVIGAFALAAWGRPRATLDIDFMIQTTTLPEALSNRLEELGFHFDEVWDRYNPMIRHFHRRFRSGRTPVDIMLRRDEHDAAAFARRRKKRFNERYLWFPSPEDLLLQKLKVRRPQDLVDAEGIVSRMRGKIDRRYLAHWANRLGIRAELAHVLR
jgi:hypothetical protein